MGSAIALLIASAIAEAGECGWLVTPALSPTDEDNDYEYMSGVDGDPERMYRAFRHTVDAHSVWGWVNVEGLSISRSDAATGNGTYTIQRISTCADPVEDLEAYGRGEFKARVAVDNDGTANAYAHMLVRGGSIKGAGSLPWTVHAHGGAQIVSTAPAGGANEGEVQVGGTILGVQMQMKWKSKVGTGGTDEVTKVYSDSASGWNGRSIETVTCHTELETAATTDSWGTWDANCARIEESKEEVKVWGTCDGAPSQGGCGIVKLILHVTRGY